MEELHQHKTPLGTSEITCGSKHEEIAQETAHYNSPVDPTLEFEWHRFNRRAEPATRESKHQLIRCSALDSVGSTDDPAPDDPTKST